jgi:hypothetical protein
VYSNLAPGSLLVRVYDPARNHAKALTFRDVGPINRFDHHRASPPSVPVVGRPGLWQDPDRAVSYFGRTLSCCLAEVFGDTGTIERSSWTMALVEVRAPLALLDLRGNAAMRAGTVEALCKTEDRDLSQRWARYFYEEHAQFGALDGLHFNGAHNGEECLLLFERARPTLHTEPDWQRPLAHRALDREIERVALALNMLVI